jgi:hypothetical protein
MLIRYRKYLGKKEPMMRNAVRMIITTHVVQAMILKVRVFL